MKEITMLKIEKGIAMPFNSGTGDITRALKTMAIGDSFLLPTNRRNSANSSAIRNGIKIATRAIDKKTVRVWRIA